MDQTTIAKEATIDVVPPKARLAKANHDSGGGKDKEKSKNDFDSIRDIQYIVSEEKK
jgi:hypothetical protein